MGQDMIGFLVVMVLAHTFNHMSYQGVSDPLLHLLMINAHVKTRDALRGDMVFDDATFLLPSWEIMIGVKN